MITLRPGDLQALEAHVGINDLRKTSSRNFPAGEDGVPSMSLGSQGSVTNDDASLSQRSESLQSSIQEQKRRWWHCCGPQRVRRLEKIVTSTRFNMSMGALIVINMVLMSIELDMHPMATESEVMLTFFDYPNIPQWFFDMFEAVFFFIFGVELVARVIGSNCKALRELSTYIDSVALLPLVLMVLFDLQSGKHLMLLRVVRLMKLFRLLRLIRLFKELQFLAKSFVSALRTLIWIGLLLLMTVYCVAIVCTMLVGQNDNFKASDAKIQMYEAHYGLTVDIARHWGSIMRSVLTLFQIFTLDNWSEIVRPIIETHAPWMFFFFAAFIFTTSFGLLNLLMGAIVDHTMSVAREAEMERERLLKEEYKQVMLAAGRLFAYIDQDHDGVLSAAELMDFLAANNLKEVLGKDMASLHLKIDYDELNEICHSIAEEWLDSGDIGAENDGISLEEFVGAAMRLQGPARSQDLLATLIAAKSALSYVQAVDQSLHDLHERLDLQNQDMADRFDRLTSMLGSRNDSGNSGPPSWGENDSDGKPPGAQKQEDDGDGKLDGSQGDSISTTASAPSGQASSAATTPMVDPLSAVGSPALQLEVPSPERGRDSARGWESEDSSKDRDKGKNTNPETSLRLPVSLEHANPSCSWTLGDMLDNSPKTAKKAQAAGSPKRRASISSLVDLVVEEENEKGDVSTRCVQKIRAKARDGRSTAATPSQGEGALEPATPAAAQGQSLNLKTERAALGKHASRRMSAILTSLSKDDTYSHANITTILRNATNKPGNRSPSEGSEEDKEAESFNAPRKSAVERAADAFRGRRKSKAGTASERADRSSVERKKTDSASGTCFVKDDASGAAADLRRTGKSQHLCESPRLPKSTKSSPALSGSEPVGIPKSTKSSPALTSESSCTMKGSR